MNESNRMRRTRIGQHVGQRPQPVGVGSCVVCRRVLVRRRVPVSGQGVGLTKQLAVIHRRQVYEARGASLGGRGINRIFGHREPLPRKETTDGSRERKKPIARGKRRRRRSHRRLTVDWPRAPLEYRIQSRVGRRTGGVARGGLGRVVAF